MCVVDEATMWRKPLFASLLLRAPSGNPQLLAQHEDAHAEKDRVGTEIRRGRDRSNGTAPAAPAVGWCCECLDVSPWPRPSTALPSPGGSCLAQLFVYQTKISSSSLSSSSRAWLRVHPRSRRPLEGSANGSLRTPPGFSSSTPWVHGSMHRNIDVWTGSVCGGVTVRAVKHEVPSGARVVAC